MMKGNVDWHFFSPCVSISDFLCFPSLWPSFNFSMHRNELSALNLIVLIYLTQNSLGNRQVLNHETGYQFSLAFILLAVARKWTVKWLSQSLPEEGKFEVIHVPRSVVNVPCATSLAGD